MIFLTKREKTRKHSNRMRTALFLSSGGGSAQPPSQALDVDPLDAGHVTCEAC